MGILKITTYFTDFTLSPLWVQHRSRVDSETHVAKFVQLSESTTVVRKGFWGTKYLLITMGDELLVNNVSSMQKFPGGGGPVFSEISRYLSVSLIFECQFDFFTGAQQTTQFEFCNLRTPPRVCPRPLASLCLASDSQTDTLQPYEASDMPWVVLLGTDCPFWY